MMAVEPDDSFDFSTQQRLQQRKQHLQSQVKLPPMPPREEFPFLRADHSFDASSLADPASARDPASICLSFTSTDVVYVHYVHASGWGDVTLVRTAERGWVPIDYFKGFTDARAIPLLAAIASFVARPRAQRILGTTGDDGLTFSEAAINEIISGTKLLLSKTDTLSRDSRLVAMADSVRLCRKALLTELAHIVYIAKNNKHSTNQEVISKLVRGCFRTLAAGANLMDTVDEPEIQALLEPRRESRHRSASSRSSQRSARSSHSDSSLADRSDVSRKSAHSQTSQASSSDWDESHPLYRMRSFADHAEVPKPLARLHEVAGAFTGYLRAFLDPSTLLSDSDSPETSPAILTVTRHCMLACRELLTVLDAVTADTPDDDAFETEKDVLLTEIRKLVSAARSVVAALPPAPASLRAVATQNLIVVAARCNDLGLRCARECATMLAARPFVTLPGDRSYPIFEGSEPLDLEADPDAVPAPYPVLRGIALKSTLSSADQESEPNKERLNSVASTEASATSESTNASGSFANSVASVNSIAVDPLDSSVFSPTESPSASASGLVAAAPRNGQLNPELAASTTSVQSTSQGDDEEVGLIYRNDKVRGGSLQALVEWLTAPEPPEFELRVFLLCFRLFATSREVVIELGARTPSPEVQRFASVWIESFWVDDDATLSALSLIVDAKLVNARRQLTATGAKYAQLVDRPLTPVFPPVATSSTTSIDSSISSSSSRRPSLGPTLGSARQQLSGASTLNLAASFREFGLGARRSSRRTSQDESGVRRIMSGSSISVTADEPGNGVDQLLARTPQEIAQQLTLMWFDIFAAMRPSELLDQRFASTKRSLGLAPNVNQLVLCSNHLTAFVGDTILRTELTSRQRAKVVKHWLRVADEMFTIGNLNGVVTVILTLQSTRISRLRKVWDSVGPKSQGILSKLAPFTSPERNFSEYRKELRRRSGQPCVPYIGILLGDLTLIDEGNPKFLKLNSGGQAINFDRYSKSARAISTIQEFQTVPFVLTPDPVLQAWLRSRSAKSHSMDTRHSDDQWRRSVLIQPE